VTEVKGQLSGDRAPPGGLYDGFEGYRTPTGADYERALTTGLVVPDANVLLNLYRYTAQARDDLLSVLERLADRLWVPHQVLDEFWRNREAVLRDPRDTEKSVRAMSDARDKAVNTFRAWANRVSLPQAQSVELAESLAAGFDAVINGIDRFSDATATQSARDTDKDSVLARLEAILAGRVGSRLAAKDLDAAVSEGLRRVEHRVPPGYLDKHKDEDGAAGDYIVWEQVLREAVQRRCDVLFVTGDVKEDWWRREGGEQRGPRLELVEEMRERAGVGLFMLRPTALLSLAREVLKVTVQDESVADTDRVDRLLADDESALPGGGWSVQVLEVLLQRLRDEASVQRDVIAFAAANGGIIDRDKVYELGGYAKDRSLRGFTRPINRIVQSFRDDGTVAPHAVDLLDTIYDPAADNPSMAAGFEVRAAVLPVLTAALEELTPASAAEEGSTKP
jgi:hypothetical protein